jgi:hypothetical protein
MLINMAQGKRYICRDGTKYFIPPGHNIVQVIKDNDKGKSVAELDKKKVAKPEPKNRKTVRIPREENPLLYEICVHT